MAKLLLAHIRRHAKLWDLSSLVLCDEALSMGISGAMLYDRALIEACQASCCMTQPSLRYSEALHRHVYMYDADDELDRMRQQMAETASLLASAAYEQPQLQLHHYQAKLTEHLADPTQPLNLALEGAQGAEGQADEGQVRREGSDERAGGQFNGLVGSPPRTPGQDAAGRAARAKRVANSREVCCIACDVLPDSSLNSDDNYKHDGSDEAMTD